MKARTLSQLPMSEADYQSRITDYALVRLWRFHHDRPAQNRRGRWSTPIEGHPGFPDLVLVRGPRLVVVEVKREGEQPTPEQQVWLDAWRAVPCAEVLVARPSNWPEVERMLR